MDDTMLLLWIEREKIAAGFLVAIGVAGEFLGDFIASPIIKRRDDAQQTEIARLNKEAEEARKVAAELNAKIAPRRLTAEQKHKLTDILKPFAGSPMGLDWTGPGGPEARDLASDIGDAMVKAKIAIPDTNILMDEYFRGVTLRFGNKRQKEAGIIAGFWIEVGLSAKPVQAIHSEDENELRIMIGSKP